MTSVKMLSLSKMTFWDFGWAWNLVMGNTIPVAFKKWNQGMRMSMEDLCLAEGLVRFLCLLIPWDSSAPPQGDPTSCCPGRVVLSDVAQTNDLLAALEQPFSSPSLELCMSSTLRGILNYLSVCASFRVTDLRVPPPPTFTENCLLQWFFVSSVCILISWILDVVQGLTVVSILNMGLVFLKLLFSVWQFSHLSPFAQSFPSENWKIGKNLSV